MDGHDDWLAQRFEENRTHLRAVAYRMLGSHSEADDAVQEAWLRLSRSYTSGIENLGGWLTTLVGRVCLNMLRSRRSRREEPLGEPQVGAVLLKLLCQPIVFVHRSHSLVSSCHCSSDKPNPADVTTR